MGEEEARTEVSNVVPDGTKSPEKVEKDVINNEDQIGVKVIVEENNNEEEAGTNNEGQVDAGEEVGTEKTDEEKEDNGKESRPKEKEDKKMDEDKEEAEKEKEEQKQEAKNEAIEEEKGLGEVKQEEDKKEKVDVFGVKMYDVEEGKDKMDNEEVSKKKMVDDEVSKEKIVDEEVSEEKMNDEEEGKEEMDDEEQGEEEVDDEEESKKKMVDDEVTKEKTVDEEENKEKMDNEEESKEKMDDVKEGEEELDTVKEKQEKKGSKKRNRGDSPLEKSEDQAGEKEEDPKTPTTTNRPVRQRKSVERLVAVIEKDMFREFHVEKGCGTRLKDIPNVAYKLTRRKGEDTFKLLHTIIFGRRGKAGDVKNNISRFSGFVWRDNEEKQKLKVKERLDRCVKEKLLEICDVLDIPIVKSTSKKDDIVTKLIDFLVAPHATTTVLLAEKEQSSKGKKRGRDGSALRSLGTSRRHPAKSRKRSSDSKRGVDKGTSETEDGSEEEEEVGEETNNGVLEKSEDENSEHSESKEKNDASEASEEDMVKARKGSKRNSSKDSAGKGKSKEVTTPKKPTLRGKEAPKRSPSNLPMISDDVDTSPKVFSRKKKNDQGDEEKAPVSKRSASKRKSGKRAVNGKEKPKDAKTKPTDDELRNAVSEILKQVDFTTATFKDILKQLSKRFSADLTSRKAAIKLMLQDELTKLADEAEDEEGEDNEDAEMEEATPAEQGVMA